MHEEAGRRFGSKYELGSMLGRGAMGSVYRSTELVTLTPVAIKLLHPHLSSDPEVVNRFLQERLVLNKISHPGVVSVVDMVVEGDELGIVMELVDGLDLRQVMKTTSIEPREAVRIAAAIAEGLVVIHENDVVHRDLKPANVLLDPSGGLEMPKISDFGVARLVGSAGTKSTGAIGTPVYMAPEALQEGSGAHSPADIYALGIMIYEMLIGVPPYTGESPLSVLMAHVTKPVPQIDGMSAEFSSLLSEMLAKDPESRPTALECSERLSKLVDLVPDDSAPTAAGSERAMQATTVRSAGESLVPRPPGSMTGPATATATDDAVAPFVPRPPSFGTSAQLAMASSSGGGLETDSVTKPRYPASHLDDATVIVQPNEPDRPPRVPTINDGGRRISPSALVSMAAGVVMLVVAGLAVRTIAGGATETVVEPVEYAFAPVFLTDEVPLTRVWSVSEDGTALTGSLRLDNGSSETFNGSVVEVIPKELVDDVAKINFSPEPTEIVDADPIVSYDVADLAPGEFWTASYVVQLESEISSSTGLASLAIKQVRAEAAHFVATDTEVSEVTLDSIRLVVDTDRTYEVGDPIPFRVEGTLSNGDQADASILETVVTTSSDLAIIELFDGVAVAASPGEANLTAKIGDLTSSASVTVEGTPESTNVAGPAVTGRPAVTPATPSTPTTPTSTEATGTTGITKPPVKPGAPSSVRASATGTSVAISWAAPSGGAEVDGYVVTIRPGGSQRTASGRSLTWSGLSAGTYTFSVTAKNAAGAGPSATSNSVVVAKAPAPTFTSGLRVTYPTATSARVSFGTKECTTARYFGDVKHTAQGWPSAIPPNCWIAHGHTFTNLDPGTYQVSVEIRLADGQSATTGPTTITIERTAEKCTIIGPAQITGAGEGAATATYSSNCSGWSATGTSTITSAGVLAIPRPVSGTTASATITVGSGATAASRAVTATWPATTACTISGPATLQITAGETATATYTSSCSAWLIESVPGYSIGATSGVLTATPTIASGTQRFSVFVGPGTIKANKTVTVIVDAVPPPPGERCKISGPIGATIEPDEAIRAQFSATPSACTMWSVSSALFSISGGTLTSGPLSSNTSVTVTVSYPDGSGADSAGFAVIVDEVEPPPTTN